MKALVVMMVKYSAQTLLQVQEAIKNQMAISVFFTASHSQTHGRGSDGACQRAWFHGMGINSWLEDEMYHLYPGIDAQHLCPMYHGVDNIPE
jgi:hypothetical protein